MFTECAPFKYYIFEKRLMDEKIRINKYLAMCGVASRREADKYIEEGRVTVNGAIVSNGTMVEVGDVVMLDDNMLKIIDKRVVYACYKPIGVTCTAKDPYAEKTINDVFTFEHRVTYAGRLDKDSEGLLLMTNDGTLIDRLMRGRNGHEKEYEVKVNKSLSDVFIQRIQYGVYLQELNTKTKPCKVTKTGDKSFNITLTEGLNREIRRMCQNFDYEVTSLKRIRVANVKLGALQPGEYRELDKEELMELVNTVMND